MTFFFLLELAEVVNREERCHADGNYDYSGHELLPLRCEEALAQRQTDQGVVLGALSYVSARGSRCSDLDSWEVPVPLAEIELCLLRAPGETRIRPIAAPPAGQQEIVDILTSFIICETPLELCELVD